MTAKDTLAAILSFHDSLPDHIRHLEQQLFIAQLFMVGIYTGVIFCLCMRGKLP